MSDERSRVARWNQRYRNKPLIWSSEPSTHFLQLFERAKAAGVGVGRALDLGCGEGRHGIYLASKGWHVTCVDFSDVAISKAQQIATRRGLNIQWHVADAEQVNLGHEAFDLLVVAFLHTDSAARRRWLANAQQHIAPGGFFLYVGHDPRNLQ